MSAVEKIQPLLHESLESLSLPDVYIRLREVMQSDDASMADAAEVLSMDPALAARVLRIANSAAYGLRAEVDTVARAASIVGMQKLHDLALAASVSATMASFDSPLMDLRTFWYRSVHCGFVAKALAEGAGLGSAEALFVRGLLHDIGHLLMYAHSPIQSRESLAHSNGSLQDLMHEEQKRMGIDALHLSADLALHWQLPESIVNGFIHLLDPWHLPADQAREGALLHIAVQLSHGMDADLLVTEIVQAIRPEIWALAELPPDVGASALDASALEMTDAMYRLLTD